jgi:hypothetical protein
MANRCNPDDSDAADTRTRNLILLFPIGDAAPMSAPGFAGIAVETAILDGIIGHTDPLVIEQHLHARESNPALRRTTIPFVAATRLSTMIL